MERDLICGLNAVLAALSHNPEILEVVWVSAERADRRVEAVIDAARMAGIKFHKVPRAKLDRLAAGIPHQGVVARVRAAITRSERELPGLLAALRVPLLLILDGVQDPRNLGACLRTACAAGAHAAIMTRERSAPITATVRRAAAGAAEMIPIFQVTNLARTLRSLKEAGIWLIGASQDGGMELFSADLRGPLALILGSEGEGLRRLTRDHCDALIRIPMAEQIESLNVAVAAGICLYEARRQRQSA